LKDELVIQDDAFVSFYQKAEEISKMLFGMIKSLEQLSLNHIIYLQQR